MRPFPFLAVAALAAPLARAQVNHTFVDEWTGGATASVLDPYQYPAVLEWSPVMGWWTNASFPYVRAESTTTIDFVVPPDPTGAPVEYGWDSYLRFHTRSDVYSSNYVDRDEYVSLLTPGGSQPFVVHWESTRRLDIWGGYLMCPYCPIQNPLAPINVMSQVGSPASPWNPVNFDAWIGPFNARQPAGATITVSTRVTATYVGFDPAPITASGSGPGGCGGVANSTGLPAYLEMGGSPALADDSMWVSVWNLPPNSFGLLCAAEGWSGVPAGTSTQLCLGSFARRFQIVQASPAGEVAWRLPAAQFPSPMFITQPWFYFQHWYRDANPQGANVSNVYGVRYF